MEIKQLFYSYLSFIYFISGQIYHLALNTQN